MKKSVFVIFVQFVFLLGILSVSSYASTATFSPIKSQSYRGIPYLSGGFGADEREALSSMSKDDNLKLIFALENKDFLGGAHVLIKDAKGKTVLEANSDGPWFFTKLPEGRYTVLATAQGKTLRRVAHVSSKGQTQVHFAWVGPSHQVAGRDTTHSLAKK